MQAGLDTFNKFIQNKRQELIKLDVADEVPGVKFPDVWKDEWGIQLLLEVDSAENPISLNLIVLEGDKLLMYVAYGYCADLSGALDDVAGPAFQEKIAVDESLAGHGLGFIIWKFAEYHLHKYVPEAKRRVVADLSGMEWAKRKTPLLLDYLMQLGYNPQTEYVFDDDGIYVHVFNLAS